MPKTNWTRIYNQGGVPRRLGMGTCISTRLSARKKETLYWKHSWVNHLKLIHQISHSAQSALLSQTPVFLGELCNLKDTVQTQSAAVSNHSSFSATSPLRFSDIYFPTVVFAQQPITLTESSFLESLTFWPEWSTSAWLKRNFKPTICQRDTLVLLLLNIFTKNQGFTKVKTLFGINDKGPKNKSVLLI